MLRLTIATRRRRGQQQSAVMGAQGTASPPAFHPGPWASPMSSSHYDVIIIGSGAGGGTLVHRLAPSGKRILLLERGDYVPREPDNWSTRAVNVEGKYQTKEHWRDKAGRTSIRTPITGSAATPSSTAPRCSGCAGRTSASSAPRRHLARVAHRLRRAGALLHARPSTSTRCTASAGRIRPSRPRARPTRYPAVSHEPRIQQLSDDFARLGLSPFHVPLGIMLDERTGGGAAASAAAPATAIRAWSGQVGRPGGVRGSGAPATRTSPC